MTFDEHLEQLITLLQREGRGWRLLQLYKKWSPLSSKKNRVFLPLPCQREVSIICHCSPFYQNSALYAVIDGWQP